MIECDLQGRTRDRRNRLDQAMGKFASDRGADLRDVPHGRQAVESRHQRILQGRRNRQRRKRGAKHVTARLFSQQVGFEHRFGEFFHKERHAVGLGDDLLQHFVRQRLACRQATDHLERMASSEAVQRIRGDVRTADPGRRKFRTKGNHQQHGQLERPLDESAEQVERGWVDPVRIFHQGQNRRTRGQTLEQRHKGADRPLFGFVRRHVERRISRGGRNREQRREHRREVRSRQTGERDERFQLVEPLLGGLVAHEARRAPNRAKHGIKRLVDVMSGTLKAHRDMISFADMFAQVGQNARFADAGLAGEQHDLPLALVCVAPALRQQRDLPLAADKGGHRLRQRGLEAVEAHALPTNHPGVDRRRQPSNRLRSERLQLEGSAEQTARRFRDDDLSRLRDTL